MSLPFSSAEQAGGHPAQLGGQPGGQAGREPAQLALSPSALISAMLRPPSCELSASRRSRVPWHTEQTRVTRNRCTSRVRSLSLRSERSTAATALS